jgi:hypothetical protein
MPDVRTLLDSAATGAPRTADPVAAVHARVRRRTARRRAAVATGATLAVAATGTAVVAARPARTSGVTPLATGAPAAMPAWRRTGQPPHEPRYAAEYGRLRALVETHPETFLGLMVQGTDNDAGWMVAVSLGSDADPEAWRTRVAAAAGTMPWEFKRCERPTAAYDDAAAEIAATAWPSGAEVKAGPVPHAVLYADTCDVFVGLTGTRLDERDRAYAERQWGDLVLVYVKPSPVP